jgi:hypothetical protein
MAWNSYGLDRRAQKIVLTAKLWDESSLNQSFKMRMSAVYGLERFWGEHLRLQNREPVKSKYWKATWDTLVEVMEVSGINIPNEPVKVDDTQSVQAMSEKLWQLTVEDQRVALAVLIQLCDCLIWWTQRVKGTSLAADE